MKKIFVLGAQGEKLFEGSRRDAKHFIRKNAIKRYRLVETFDEKVVQLPVVDDDDDLDLNFDDFDEE